MVRTGDRRAKETTAAVVAALVLVVAGGATCSTESQPGSKPAKTISKTDAKTDGGSQEAQPRVGNPSNTGMDTVPDWNALARDLRARVGPRMPDALPTDPKAACARMLDEALAFYVETEINPEHQRRRRAEMASTRDADLKGCVADTSVAAATCVTILLGDRNTEFPWLLDQCSRAYPREPAGGGGSGHKPRGSSEE